MLIIGLTGSIATGKSTVSSTLAAPPHSLPIIDADVLARKVVEPGTRGYTRILSHFGPSTPDLLVPVSESMPECGLDGKGRALNRPVLGRRVFGDTPERQRDRAVLNGIVHPAVKWEIAKAVLGAYLAGHWAVVLDVPLLFESSMHLLCGTVTVVAVREPETQLQRLMSRDAHLSREDALNRVHSQTDVRVKAGRCRALGPDRGVVLWNDGSRDDLKSELDEAILKLKQSRPAWWTFLVLACPPLAIATGLWAYWQNVRATKSWEQSQKAKL